LAIRRRFIGSGDIIVDYYHGNQAGLPGGSRDVVSRALADQSRSERLWRGLVAGALFGGERARRVGVL